MFDKLKQLVSKAIGSRKNNPSTKNLPNTQEVNRVLNEGLQTQQGDVARNQEASNEQKAIQEAQSRNLIHPVTKEVVKPLNNVNTDIKERVRSFAKQYGWDSGQEWNALEELIHRESSWNPDAVEPNSKAFGLFQILPSAHPEMVGAPIDKQIQWGLNYIKNKTYYDRTTGTNKPLYENPSGAISYHNTHNSY